MGCHCPKYNRRAQKTTYPARHLRCAKTINTRVVGILIHGGVQKAAYNPVIFIESILPGFEEYCLWGKRGGVFA